MIQRELKRKFQNEAINTEVHPFENNNLENYQTKNQAKKYRLVNISFLRSRGCHAPMKEIPTP